MPREECRFGGSEVCDDGVVRDANRRAGVPFWRVVHAEVIER
jgi:hypothetical protein